MNEAPSLLLDRESMHLSDKGQSGQPEPTLVSSAGSLDVHGSTA